MKMSKLVFCLVSIGLTISCNNAENKNRELAEGLCDCYSRVEKKFTAPETSELLLICDTASDPVASFRKQYDGFSESVRFTVANDMGMRFPDGDARPAYSACVDSLKSIYVEKEATKEKKSEQLLKAISEMRGLKDCKLAHGYYKLMEAAAPLRDQPQKIKD